MDLEDCGREEGETFQQEKEHDQRHRGVSLSAVKPRKSASWVLGEKWEHQAPLGRLPASVNDALPDVGICRDRLAFFLNVK